MKLLANLKYDGVKLDFNKTGNIQTIINDNKYIIYLLINNENESNNNIKYHHNQIIY